MVITIEPGIYIPEENIGVRIEDTVLVTENGSKNLSGALPREVEKSRSWLASNGSPAGQANGGLCRRARGLLRDWHAGGVAGLSPAAIRIDHYAYDMMLHAAGAPRSGSRSRWWSRSTSERLNERGGSARHAADSCRGARRDREAEPEGRRDRRDAARCDRMPADDERLEASLRATRNLILPCE